MKYEVTFFPKNGDAKCRNTLTFGDHDAVDVAKKVFKWAMTGYYSDIEVKKVKKNMENKTISKQIQTIMQLVYQINSVETFRAKTGNLPTVFIEFRGHTCQFNARIYDEGWMSEIDPDYNTTIYLDQPSASEKLHILIERLGVTLKLKARKEKRQNNV